MLKVIIFTILWTHFLTKTVKPDFINKNVVRVIDLSTQLVKINTAITLENIGKGSESTFLIVLEPNTLSNLSYISIKDSHNDDLRIIDTKVENGTEMFKVKLNRPIAIGHKAAVSLELVFTNQLIPYPSSITQKERQLVRYFGNHYFYSPYPTLKQTTVIVIKPGSIENYTKLKPMRQSDSALTFGPYSGIDKLTLDPLIIHFENYKPFLTVTCLKRSIEVSHWDNIAVEENIDVLHAGAKLKGPFSRIEYQYYVNSYQHIVRSYKTILPASAHSIYYRDITGNISTSQVRVQENQTELELHPRYPLFGGWRTSYSIGYSVPSNQYLYKSNNRYVLCMPLIDNVFDDMHVAELETNIMLPVDARNIKVSTPYVIQRLPNTRIYKYLDRRGRPVIRLRKTNLVEQHIQDFKITYDWEPLFLFYEPILISVAVYILFIVVIICKRLDFSISQPKRIKIR